MGREFVFWGFSCNSSGFRFEHGSLPSGPFASLGGRGIELRHLLRDIES